MRVLAAEGAPGQRSLGVVLVCGLLLDGIGDFATWRGSGDGRDLVMMLVATPAALLMWHLRGRFSHSALPGLGLAMVALGMSLTEPVATASSWVQTVAVIALCAQNAWVRALLSSVPVTLVALVREYGNYGTVLSGVAMFGSLTAIAAVGGVLIRDGHRARRALESTQAAWGAANTQLQGALQVKGELVLAHERARAARELHDGWGHRLTVVSMMVQLACRRRDVSDDSAWAAVAEAREASDAALAEVSVWAQAPEPPVGASADSHAGIDAIVSSFRSTGLEIRVDYVGDPGPLPEPVTLFVIRFLQEGLTNVVRHALAQRAVVAVRRTPTHLRVVIGDDGIGLSSVARVERFGLRSLRERSRLLGGTLHIGRSSLGGLEVAVNLTPGESCATPAATYLDESTGSVNQVVPDAVGPLTDRRSQPDRPRAVAQRPLGAILAAVLTMNAVMVFVEGGIVIETSDRILALGSLPVFLGLWFLRGRFPASVLPGIAFLVLAIAVTLLGSTADWGVFQILWGLVAFTAQHGWRWGATVHIAAVATQLTFRPPQQNLAVSLLAELLAALMTFGVGVMLRKGERDRVALEHSQEELRVSHARLRDALKMKEALVLAQERDRSARALHRGLGRSLTLVTTTLRAAQQRHADGRDSSAWGLVAQAGEQTNRALADMRLWVRALDPPPATLGDPEAQGSRIEAIADSFRGTGLEVRVSDVGDRVPLGEVQALFLTRMLQEGLTNVLRHSGAQTVHIALETTASRLRIAITDDGVGSDATPDGLGLGSLRERAGDLGGQLRAGTASGGGFELVATLPLPAPERVAV